MLEEYSAHTHTSNKTKNFPRHERETGHSPRKRNGSDSSRRPTLTPRKRSVRVAMSGCILRPTTKFSVASSSGTWPDLLTWTTFLHVNVRTLPPHLTFIYFFLFIQCGLCMGIYKPKKNNQWRLLIWKPTHLGTVTPSGCPISHSNRGQDSSPCTWGS